MTFIRSNIVMIIPIIMVIECFLFYQASLTIGFWWSILLLFSTGFLGTKIVGLKGKYKADVILKELQTHQNAACLELFDSLLLLFAGLLIILPGFFTDSVGALLLIPPLRKLLTMGLLFIIPRNEHQGGVYTTSTTAQQSFIHNNYASDSENNEPKRRNFNLEETNDEETNDEETNNKKETIIIEGEFHRKND